MYETFRENCFHFILKWFQPNSFGELCFLQESYGNMQKIQILRAPSIQHQWVYFSYPTKINTEEVFNDFLFCFVLFFISLENDIMSTLEDYLSRIWVKKNITPKRLIDLYIFHPLQFSKNVRRKCSYTLN